MTATAPAPVAAVVVHDIDHVRRAVRAADAVVPVLTLISAPGAAAVLGAAVFREMIAAGTEPGPQTAVEITAMIDCADNPGHAMSALDAGCRNIVIDADAEMTEKLSAIAAQRGARLRPRPAHTFDMALHDDDRALAAWLAASPDPVTTGPVTTGKVQS